MNLYSSSGDQPTTTESDVETDDFVATDITAEDESDLLDKILGHQAIFQITNATSQRDEDDLRYEVVFTPLNSPYVNFPITQTYSWKNEIPKVQIGKLMFRALVIAALGKPRGRLADLQEKYVSAWVKDGGYWGLQLSYFKVPTKEQLAAVRDDTDSTETTT